MWSPRERPPPRVPARPGRGGRHPDNALCHRCPSPGQRESASKGGACRGRPPCCGSRHPDADARQASPAAGDSSSCLWCAHRISGQHAGVAERSAESHQLCNCLVTLAVQRLEPIRSAAIWPADESAGGDSRDPLLAGGGGAAFSCRRRTQAGSDLGPALAGPPGQAGTSRGGPFGARNARLAQLGRLASF